jgi:hypothetical protein
VERTTSKSSQNAAWRKIQTEKMQLFISIYIFTECQSILLYGSDAVKTISSPMKINMVFQEILEIRAISQIAI